VGGNRASGQAIPLAGAQRRNRGEKARSLRKVRGFCLQVEKIQGGRKLSRKQKRVKQ